MHGDVATRCGMYDTFMIRPSIAVCRGRSDQWLSSEVEVCHDVTSPLFSGWPDSAPSTADKKSQEHRVLGEICIIVLTGTTVHV